MTAPSAPRGIKDLKRRGLTGPYICPRCNRDMGSVALRMRGVHLTGHRCEPCRSLWTDQNICEIGGPRA